MCRVDCERALHGKNCWYIVTKENISTALKPMTKLEHNASSELGCLEKYKPGNRAAGRGGGVTGTLFHRRNSCTLWQRQRDLVIKHSLVSSVPGPRLECSRTQDPDWKAPGPTLECSRTQVGVFQNPGPRFQCASAELSSWTAVAPSRHQTACPATNIEATKRLTSTPILIQNCSGGDTVD